MLPRRPVSINEYPIGDTSQLCEPRTNVLCALHKWDSYNITLSSWSTAANWSINACKLGCRPWSPCRAVWRSAIRWHSVGRVWGGGDGSGCKLWEDRVPTDRDRGAVSGSPLQRSLTLVVTTSEHGRCPPCSRLAASAAATVTVTPQRGTGTTERHGDRPLPTPLTEEIGALNDAGNTGILKRLAARDGELVAYK